MSPMTTFLAGLQIILSWVMSVLAILAIFVSIVLCVAFVEFAVERGALARAYTVKVNSSDRHASSAQHRNEM